MVRLDKDKVKNLYLSGYSQNEISKILGFKVDTIKKCIQRNFVTLKEEHRKASIEKKETLRAINYEAKKCMTDKSFIMKNRSVYITKDNGDIVIDKSIAPVVTWDTPKRLTNENKYA